MLHFSIFTFTCSVQTIVDFLEDMESSSATLYDFAFQQCRISPCGKLYPRRQSLSSKTKPSTKIKRKLLTAKYFLYDWKLKDAT